MKTKSQKQRILDYLLTGKSLTKLQILQKFGCLSAGQRISELRHDYQEWNIKTEMVWNKDKTARYARYYIPK